MEKNRKEIIDYFVRKRKEKKITQKQLADITGIDQGDISKIESGKTNVSLDTLMRLADGLGMDLELNLVPKHDNPLPEENLYKKMNVIY